jgi:superfamily I DNA/RNA helicase
MPFEFHLPSFEEMRSTPDGLAMLRMIDDDNFRSAMVTGCPGSGKTTVSIYRFVRLCNQQVDVQLLSFHKMLILAIQNIAIAQGITGDRVNTFNKWYHQLTSTYFNVKSPPLLESTLEVLRNSQQRIPQLTEIIIDEGQDLPHCVFQALPHYSTRFFVGADDGQQVHREHGALSEEIASTLQSDYGPYRLFALGMNFRNTFETYAFARQFIPITNQTAWDPAILERLRRSNRRGPKPMVISYTNTDQRNEHLRVTLQNAEGNVAILCPLAVQSQNCQYSGESVDEVYQLITQMGISATKYHHKTEVPNSLERYIVTTFISAKGLEFDVVIIPRLNFFKLLPEEHYVACTRAKRQLFVYQDLSNAQCNPVSNFDVNTYDAESADNLNIVAEEDFPF